MGKTIFSRKSKKLTIVGFLVLFIPTLFLSLFLFGELLGGIPSGIIHLFQILPLVILALLASKFPYHIGIILTYLGITLSILYAIFSGFPVQTIILVDSILFLPLSISGVIFIASSLKT